MSLSWKINRFFIVAKIYLNFIKGMIYDYIYILYIHTHKTTNLNVTNIKKMDKGISF